MNGKDMVFEALETAARLLSEIRDSGLKERDQLARELAKACEGLENIKTKASLRTKNGTNLAFPIKEAAENLDEAWEDAQNGDGVNELVAMVELFADSSEALVLSLRNRTVIMT